MTRSTAFAHGRGAQRPPCFPGVEKRYRNAGLAGLRSKILAGTERTKLLIQRYIGMHKQILSVGVLGVFVFFIISASLACADSRPFGVYQPGRTHAGHRVGLGRTAAHNFRAGFVVAKDDDCSKLRKNLYKCLGFTHHGARIGRIAWVAKLSFPSSRSFILDFSPVLNL